MARAATSKGPRRRPASLKPPKYPVSPPKYSRRLLPSTAQEAQRRVSRSKRRALAEVLGRYADEAHAAVLVAVPPVQLFDARDPALPEPGLEPERHHEERVVRRGQPRDRPGIEVVVVIVGDHDDVDLRQVLEGEPRGTEPARARPGQRAGPLAPVGVGQDREPVELDDERGVPDPRDGRRGRAAAERAAVIGDAGSTERPRRREGLPDARGEEAPPRPAVGPVKPGVRVPESALDMMGGLPGKRLRSHAGTACRAEEQAEEDRGRAHARSVPGCARADQTRGSRP